VLSHLLWIRCGANTENALKAADRIVQAGGFGLVIFDLSDTDMLSARRISLASWFRLRHAVEKTSSALAVFSRQFNARSCSRLQIELRRTGTTWSTHLRSVAFEAETRKYQFSRRAAFEAQRFDPLA
jgi:recombination protein RecA